MFHQLLMRTSEAPTTTDATYVGSFVCVLVPAEKIYYMWHYYRLCSTFLPKALLQRHVASNGLVTSDRISLRLAPQRYALCLRVSLQSHVVYRRPAITGYSVVRLMYRCPAYNLAAIFATDLNRKLI